MMRPVPHTMDLLWEKFQWILPLYMKPISFQSKASVVCSVTTVIFIDFCLKKLNVFSQHVGQKTNEYLNFAEQIPRNWNVDQISVLITSWDITYCCRINLLWKELMERMSEHTGLISSYQLLITAACTNTGGKMKGCHSRAADRCPFVVRHSVSQVTSFMQLGMLCIHRCGWRRPNTWRWWDTIFAMSLNTFLSDQTVSSNSPTISSMVLRHFEINIYNFDFSERKQKLRRNKNTYN